MSSKYLRNSTKIIFIFCIFQVNVLYFCNAMRNHLFRCDVIFVSDPAETQRLIDGNLQLMGFPDLFLFKASLADWNRWSFPNSVPQLQARKQILCLVLRLKCFVFVFLWDSVQLSQKFNLYFKSLFLLYSLLISNVSK